MRDLAIALSGSLLVYLFPEKRPAAAKPVPASLGSLSRPVRAWDAEGRARYLARLRALDGSLPTYRQVPVVGFGVYDSFLDLFEVTCGGKTVQVFMERCFEPHVDDEPVPGFTLAGEVRETRSEWQRVVQAWPELRRRPSKRWLLRIEPAGDMSVGSVPCYDHALHR